MSPIPRRELEELIVQYEFHPLIFDTYVEGDFDCAFLTQFIDTLPQKTTSISVVPIDWIDIPNSYLDSFGLQRGSNKSRVLALARTLEERFGSRPSNVSCIVDADNDRFLNGLSTLHYARYTDFTSMEMYTYDPKTLRKFFEFTCHLKKELVDEFIEFANFILPAQFAARCANEAMALGIAIPHFSSGLSKKGDLSSFDSTKYFKAFVNLLDRKERLKEVLDQLSEYQKVLDKDLRHKANGHDFITLLFEYIWGKNALKLHNKEKDVIRFGGRLLATALEFQKLGNHPLFERIRDSAAGHTYMCPA